MKALYGLKQSPRQWFKDIDSHLKQSNFKSLPNEPCLYYRQYQGTLNLISLYVDDLVIAGLITILKIPTKSNTADILTKPLSAEAHWRHMSSLLVNIYPEDEGR